MSYNNLYHNNYMKKTFLIGTAFACALAVGAGCKGKRTAATAEQALPLVSTVIAQEEPIAQTVEFTSSIEPYKQNFINPSMQVRIDRILVDVGSKVTTNQLLVVMDQTQLNQLDLQVANLKVDYNRLYAVYEAGGIAKQQIDQARTNLDIQIKALDNMRSNLELRSPIDGVVTARFFDPGDVFSIGSPGILQIMQINPLKVNVALSERFFMDVRVGMPAEVTVESLNNEMFPGKISLIYPSIDVATRTFTVEIAIPNNDGRLRPGMFSRTLLNFGIKNGVTVKDLAVQKQYGSNENFVFVVKDGKVIRRTVETGRRLGDRINILSGVEAGEEVVASGFSRLNNGAAIEVRNN